MLDYFTECASRETKENVNKAKLKIIINELYIIPCFDEIPLLTALLIDDRASFP